MLSKTKGIEIKETIAVKDCPFCGKIDPVEVVTSNELMEIYNQDNQGYHVVCAFTKNGCGGTGGFSETQVGAVGNWNRRGGVE